MNELITSLIDATAAMVPGVYTVEYRSGRKGVEFNEEALNKFVELIVRECATIADQAEPYKTNDLILKHFGVEE